MIVTPRSEMQHTFPPPMQINRNQPQGATTTKAFVSTADLLPHFRPNYASTWFLKQQWVQPSPSRRSWLCGQTFAHWSVFGTKEKRQEGWKSRNTTAPFLPWEEGRSCVSISTHTMGEVKQLDWGIRCSCLLETITFQTNPEAYRRGTWRERDMASNSFLYPITILMKSQNLEMSCYGTRKPRGNKGHRWDLASLSAQLQHIHQRRFKLKKWLLQVAEPHRLRQETFKMLCKVHWKCEQIIYFGRLD